MPELPEVEAVARTLRPLVERRKIRCIHVLHPIATKPQPPSQIARIAEGQRIQSVQRNGKYLWLQLPHRIVTLHFKLDGRLLWFSSAKKMFEVANQKESGVHVDVAFELNNGVLAFAVVFADHVAQHGVRCQQRQLLVGRGGRCRRSGFRRWKL